MSNLNTVPTQFKVISTQPDLKIRYSINLWNWSFGFLSLAIGILGLLIIICLNIFRGDLYVENLSKEHVPTFVMFMSIIFIPFSLYWLWTGSYQISGYKEFLATSDRLLITDTCKLLGVCSQISISTSGISHLEISLLPGVGNDDDDFWRLNILSGRHHKGNWKLFLTWLPMIKFEKNIDRPIFLYGHEIRQSSEWLGRLLADFYDVELRSP